MNLENLGVQEMNGQELVDIDGGGWRDYVIGWAVGHVIDGVVWLVMENNEEYGRRMLETGSPGGHK